VIVVADRLPATVRPGDDLAVDVHVVSDLRLPLPDLTCTATVRWAGGERTWRFAGEVEADSVARVGTLSFEVPPVAGALTLELEVAGTGLPGPVTDTDATTVVRS
jgi:hypothetical protein